MEHEDLDIPGFSELADEGGGDAVDASRDAVLLGGKRRQQLSAIGMYAKETVPVSYK